MGDEVGKCRDTRWKDPTAAPVRLCQGRHARLRHVHVCCCFIDHQYLAPLEESTGQTHQLTLSHTEVGSTFSDQSLQVALHLLDCCLQLDLQRITSNSHDSHVTPLVFNTSHLLQCHPYLLVAVLPKGVQVVPHTATEDHWVLRTQAMQAGSSSHDSHCGHRVMRPCSLT